jgi:ubiquinone/menaquinone biosynthesis C-methylase UbiE
LDYGCGTGNITKYLVDYKAKVIAADVSQKILNVLESKLNNSHDIDFHLINGFDLSEYSDNTFDLITTYSVLHHIPDYLSMINEFIRVIKPGGVLFIDHEVNPGYWEYDEIYNQYLSELGENFLKYHLYEIGQDVVSSNQQKKISKLKHFIKRKLNPENIPEFIHEGDIHTNRYDHIEWEKIKKVLLKYEIILERDYLVCKELESSPRVWDKWKDKTTDMRFILARK